jgi:hypothetical protein
LSLVGPEIGGNPDRIDPAGDGDGEAAGAAASADWVTGTENRGRAARSDRRVHRHARFMQLFCFQSYYCKCGVA